MNQGWVRVPFTVSVSYWGSPSSNRSKMSATLINTLEWTTNQSARSQAVCKTSLNTKRRFPANSTLRKLRIFGDGPNHTRKPHNTPHNMRGRNAISKATLRGSAESRRKGMAQQWASRNRQQERANLFNPTTFTSATANNARMANLQRCQRDGWRLQGHGLRDVNLRLLAEHNTAVSLYRVPPQAVSFHLTRWLISSQ